METKTTRIRELNDRLRQDFAAAGTAVMKPGIAALGAEAVARIVKTIALRTLRANDPSENRANVSPPNV
jgi:hypothetical protein